MALINNLQDSEKIIISAKNLGKEFNGVWVLNNIDFDLKAGVPISNSIPSSDNAFLAFSFIFFLSILLTPNVLHFSSAPKKMFSHTLKNGTRFIS